MLLWCNKKPSKLSSGFWKKRKDTCSGISWNCISPCGDANINMAVRNGAGEDAQLLQSRVAVYIAVTIAFSKGDFPVFLCLTGIYLLSLFRDVFSPRYYQYHGRITLWKLIIFLFQKPEAEKSPIIAVSGTRGVGGERLLSLWELQ